VAGQLPADFSLFALTIVPEPKPVVFKVLWDTSGSAWADSQPWPDYYAPGVGAIIIDDSTPPTPTSFLLVADNSVYSGVRSPVVGQIIGFWDGIANKFRKKTLATVTGTGPWTCTASTSAGASDTTYTPIGGQRAMPWADGLTLLESPVLKYFDGLGPGEMFTTFLPDGRRQRRSPRSPRLWPATISSDLLVPVLTLDAVLNATLIEGNGVSPSVGTPGVLVHMITLHEVAVFPLAS
jgi:hypothetical protein